ncbi:hypothetical protein ELH77_19190 [Rhizobium ruizarguesonis]|uniref:hypothetical protein n=1 Tax=Rhizobium ruizarguesonis TaxID=2081791 RepID=UPI001030BF8F|nr:hypothetical protein [Rhizobium ruizarguesonis]TAZ20732.1 hypothetical protein ELH77_19190 [Rhizobium ruizarguesonis]
MTKIDDDNVQPIGVKFKPPPSNERTLTVVRDVGCDHKLTFVNGKVVRANYLIREGETEVECGLCGKHLDPMFVLLHLANQETSWIRNRQAYLEEHKRLNSRRRTKCEHCQKITRISSS